MLISLLIHILFFMHSQLSLFLRYFLFDIFQYGYKLFKNFEIPLWGGIKEPVIQRS